MEAEERVRVAGVLSRAWGVGGSNQRRILGMEIFRGARAFRGHGHGGRSHLERCERHEPRTAARAATASLGTDRPPAPRQRGAQEAAGAAGATTEARPRAPYTSWSTTSGKGNGQGPTRSTTSSGTNEGRARGVRARRADQLPALWWRFGRRPVGRGLDDRHCREPIARGDPVFGSDEDLQAVQTQSPWASSRP